MKFRSIFSVLILTDLITRHVYGGDRKLDPGENEERWASCGRIGLPTPSSDASGKAPTEDFPWLYYTVLNKIANPRYFPSFPISHRHMFTSSQLILDEKMRFRLDNKSIYRFLCQKGSNREFWHLDVPEEYLKDIEIRKPGRSVLYSNKIRRARLFLTCGMNNFDSEYSPLLLEFEPKDPKDKAILPCLADKNTKFQVGDSVDSYGFFYGMQHYKLQITEILENRWILTNRYERKDDRGGPLVKVIDGISTVIGLKASDGTNKNVDSVYFYDLSALSEDICEWSGVCTPDPTTTTTTTEEPSTSTTTSDPPSTTSEDLTTFVTVSTTEEASSSTSSATEPPTRATTTIQVCPQFDFPEGENPFDYPVEEDLDMNNIFFVDADFRILIGFGSKLNLFSAFCSVFLLAI